MSRYSIPAQDPDLTVIVGWDNPLLTFFAQVFNASIADDDDACVLWIGTAPQAISTVAALQAQLTGWATIRPTSWTASPAINRLPRRRPRSSGGRTSSCTTLGRPAPTVPNSQPRGRLVLPLAPAINRTIKEVLPMPPHRIDTPYQVITDRILALLARGTVPWQQPWDSALGLPRNLFSQRSYRGINVWLLTAMGFPRRSGPRSTRSKRLGNIRKAHGVPVVFWKVYTHEDTGTGESAEQPPAAVYRVQRRATGWRGGPGNHETRAPSRRSSDVPTWWTRCRGAR